MLATGSPRDGHQTATLGTPPDGVPAFTVAATLPRYPVVVPGDRVVVDGADPSRGRSRRTGSTWRGSAPPAR